MKYMYESPAVVAEMILIEQGFATSFANGSGIDDAPDKDYGEF